MHHLNWYQKERTALRVFAALVLGFLLFCASPSNAQNALDDIRNRGVLIIGTDATYPPFELKTGDSFEGFDIDLGNEIGKELGVKVRWENINWDGIFAALQTKKFDLVMSDVVITDKRKKEMTFSRPYFLSGQTIVHRKGDKRVLTSKDLPGKLVTVQQETTGQYAVEKLGLPNQSIRKFETMQDALLEVRNGRGDAAVGDLPALSEMIRKGYPELETTGGVFVHENYAVVAHLGEPKLLAAVNAAITKILADGRYTKIYQRWIREPLPANYIAGLDKVQNQGTLKIDAKGTTASSASVSSDEAEGTSGSAFSIRWGLLHDTLPLLLKGALMTLLITFMGLIIGLPFGLVVALGRLSPIRLVSLVATVFIETVRGTPLLLQIFAIYFVLPSVGISLDPFVSAVVALSLNSAAYIAEIFRAGIQSIDSGQMEAARAVGMSSGQAMRWVILPQTLRRVLPPLTNEAVALLKDSSLISVIGLSELMRVGREQASNSGSPITIYLALAVLYLLMTLPLTHLVRRLEARWEPISRPRVRGVKTEILQPTPGKTSI